MASNTKGWEPLEARRIGARAFQVTPFMRLARAHAAATAGNALVVVALAGSILLVDPEESRERVAMTLALTMVPFALLAPMVGPWLDRLRGGRRWVIVGANALRAVVCLLLIGEVETFDNAVPYVLAFLVLMLDKSYHLAKSALVPTTVRSDDELVQANSLLTRLSGFAGFAAAIPGGIATWLGNNIDAFGPGQAVLTLAVVVFAVAAVAGAQIPKTKVAEDRTSEEERHELRSGGILLAASAMALMRGILGFLTWLLAFWLQESDTEQWWEVAIEYGAVLGSSVVGSLLGTLVAPALRQSNMPEERILQIAMATTAAMGLVCAYLVLSPEIPLLAAALLVLSVGVTVSTAKLAFDSLVQRDAPDANRGRSFAKFETRFQLVWVAGSFVPVLVTIPLWAGFLAVTGASLFALVSYLAGIKAVDAGKPVQEHRLTKNLQHKLRNRASSGRGTSDPSEQPPGTGTPGQTQRGDPERALRPPPPPPPPPPASADPDSSVVIDPTKLH